MSENLNPFAIAQAQLDEAARILQLDPDMHAFCASQCVNFILRYPLKWMTAVPAFSWVSGAI